MQALVYVLERLELEDTGASLCLWQVCAVVVVDCRQWRPSVERLWTCSAWWKVRTKHDVVVFADRSFDIRLLVVCYWPQPFIACNTTVR